MSVRAFLSGVIITLIVVLSGCEKDDRVVVYSAPKETVKPAAPTQTMPKAEEPVAPNSGEIAWTVPQGWKQLPGDGQMRYASFGVSEENPQIQLSVIPLNQSSLVSNVNRWEGQVGLKPTAEADLPKVVKTVEANGLTFQIVDLQSPDSANPKQRMLAAILDRPDQMWFFKLFGPAEVVGAQKEKFDAFVKSIHFGGAPVGEPAGEPSGSGGSSIATNPPPAEASSPKGAKWNAPADWVAEPEKPMRLASYKAGEAEVIITQFGQDNFGGLLANINRWRRQAGMPEITDEKEAGGKRTTVNGKDAALFDFAGPTNRVRVVMVVDGGLAWFFKIQGPAGAVANQQQPFDAFVQSVQFAK